MASRKKKAAEAGAGAVGAAKAARSNKYVSRLLEDEDLRESLQDAYESSRKAYDRMSGRRGPAKAIMDDRKTQKELQAAASSLKEAADSFRGTKKRRGRRGGLLLLLIAGAVSAVLLSEGLRKKILDTLFGAEEEFEYTSTTVAPAPTEPSESGTSGGNSSGEPAAATESTAS